MSTTITAGIVGVALLATVLALVRRSPALRRAVSVVVLATLAWFAGAAIVRAHHEGWRPTSIYLALAFALSAGSGVAARRSWGRWLAITGGLGGFALFGCEILQRAIESWRTTADHWLWSSAVVVGSAVLVMAMVGPSMGDHFARAPAHRLRGSRGALLYVGAALALSAVPGLLLQATNPCGHYPERILLQVLAAVAILVLVAGAILVIRQKTVGVLLICSGSVVVTQVVTSGSVYSPGFLVPAILAGPLVLAAVADAAWRRLRG